MQQVLLDIVSEFDPDMTRDDLIAHFVAKHIFSELVIDTRNLSSQSDLKVDEDFEVDPDVGC